MEVIMNCELSQLLDGKTMWRTLINMTRPDMSDVYDPDFVLGLLVNILRHAPKLNCRDFVRVNALSFAFAATSCAEECRRAHAYAVLSRFARRLRDRREDAAPFAEADVIAFLITAFKHSVTDTCQRMPNVVSHFFARVAKLALAPADAAYAPLMAYLALKPVLNLRAVPEFTKMFYSASTQHHHAERLWTLRLCAQAAISVHDYEVFNASYVLESCQMLFASTICDYQSKHEALCLFVNCARLHSVAADMFRRLNFTTWIVGAVQHHFTTSVEAVRLADIFLLIVFQVYHNRDYQANSDTANERRQRKENKTAASRYVFDRLVELNALRLSDVLREKLEEPADRIEMLHIVCCQDVDNSKILKKCPILAGILSPAFEAEHFYRNLQFEAKTVS